MAPPRALAITLGCLAACTGPGPGADLPDAAGLPDAPALPDARPDVDAAPDTPAPDAAPDAPPLVGHPDWTSVAATCGTLADVAWISDSEVFLACGSHGLLHVTTAGVDVWQAPGGAVSRVAAAGGEVRALACKTVYRYAAGTWISEGAVGALSLCGMGFAGGDGGWFVGTRSFGGNGGFWRRDATGWVVGADTVRGFEDIIALGETEFLANTIGVSTGLNHMRRVGTSWTSVSDHPFGVRAMWRAGTTSTIYFANTPGNGPGGGGGGIYRWNADAYTFEWDPPGFERINAIWGRSPTEIYAAGDTGTLVRSTGTGTWTAVPSGTTANLAQIWSWNGSLVVASTTTIHVVP